MESLGLLGGHKMCDCLGRPAALKAAPPAWPRRGAAPVKSSPELSRCAVKHGPSPASMLCELCGHTWR